MTTPEDRAADDVFQRATDEYLAGNHESAAHLWASISGVHEFASFNAGNTYAELGHRKRARRYLRRAIQEGESAAYFNLGRTLSKERSTEALACFWAAAAFGDPKGFIAAGLTLAELRRLPEAKGILQRGRDSGMPGCDEALEVLQRRGTRRLTKGDGRRIVAGLESRPEGRPVGDQEELPGPLVAGRAPRPSPPSS